MNSLAGWGGTLAIAACAVSGDVLVSLAMKRTGDLGQLYRDRGAGFAIKAAASQVALWAGVGFMALAFFALMFALSWADVSFVAPASAALTFIGNALAAKMFLREDVNRTRWIAALLAAAGVALVAR